MNIAKASAKDLEAALSLLGLLDTVSGGYYPSDTDSECENDPLRFDEDDRAHLDQLWKRLKGCLDMSPGFQGRVIFGGVTMMDPRNRIIDEHADVLKLHPRLLEAAAAAAEERSSTLQSWIDGPPPVRDDGGLVIVELAADARVDGQEHFGLPIIASRWSSKMKTTGSAHRIDYASVVRYIDIAGHKEEALPIE